MMKFSDSTKLFISIILCEGIGALSSLAAQSSIPIWYAQLQKSPFTPPNFVFPMVWITLYLMMAIAAFFVWRKGLATKGVNLALAFFLVQLIFNALWMPLFFGLQQPFYALIDAVFMAITVAVTTVLFYRQHRGAAALMLPYFLWVCFAAYLNFEVLRLNF